MNTVPSGNYLIEQTANFAKWHAALNDPRARIAIARRMERMTVGDVQRAQQLAKENWS